ncbi:MAG: hypothetical protein N2039_13745 [Gemmataceae bacterium]|nr:hypothetical protein [Gemmataceae bacterium]
MVAILATSEHDRIDPRLKELAEQVRRKHPEWTGFEVAHQNRGKLRQGTPEKFRLVGDAFAEVTWKGFDPDGRTVLSVVLPTLDEFTYSCACTKFLPVVTHHRTESGKRLIVALNVQPCQKEVDKEPPD